VTFVYALVWRDLAVRAIEHVKKTVPVGLNESLHGLAIHRQVQRDWVLHGIPIVHIVRRELVVPSEFARVGVERHHTTRV